MAKNDKAIKVLITKTGLDAHWRGPVIVATALRDAGMEVIFAGHLKANEIAETAIQEDVDVIGLNVGGRYGPIKDLIAILKENKSDDFLIIAGGTIPPEDIPAIKEMGVAAAFPPESSLDDIVKYVREHVTRSC